jgi:hypothetical protein
LTSLAIPNSVTTISDFAFKGCTGLTNLIIPSSVTSFEYCVFENCTGLTTLVIPNSVTSISEFAFSGCTGLTSLTIPSSVTSIGESAFYNCTGLTNLTIPNSIDSLSQSTFYNCTGLHSLTIPSSVTSIGYAAFIGCTGLTNFIIPKTITSIDGYALALCTGLTSIYANSTLPIDLSSSSSVFYNVNKATCTLYVPVGSKSAYQAANQWGDFTNIIETTTAVPTINNTILNVYPNPTTESFQISGIDGAALITIKDLNGKNLLTKQIKGNENISVSSLSIGIYMLEIKTNEGSILKKIVKN